jgi:peptidoglycan/LPS O-acetylase OafA/YrhL
MPAATDRLAAPGAFRFILASAVFLHHTTNFNLGMAAVLLFFVLSGYWVAKMWSETYSRTHAAYFTYLVSRGWRLVPVFALCSAISWALLFMRGALPPLSGDTLHQLFSNVLILGYNSLPYQANLPSWSLDMEVQFYFVAPLLIFLISKNMLLVLGCAFLSLLGAKLGGATTVAPFLYFFAIGVMAARHDLRPGRRLAYASLAATLALLAVSAGLLFNNLLTGDPHAAPLAFTSATNVVITLMLTPWALYTVRQRTGAEDRMFGDLSYILYLLHWSVLGALATGEGSYPERIALCLAAYLLVFAASYLIWVLFDRPINVMRGVWVATRRPGEALAGASSSVAVAA